ncbi:hypothetical protein CTAYLR_001068 [Chrysophaeum taylorii]|uniref:Calpain catalytic domain-containing protein n=1 Tax=Chrysophaeum taylorii TaxID=2483200 RepID=A0AAD7XMR4_9STRA|nr:hypothetical protein CTAYLR_001068 [Chrysophaeum taylorii]
MSGQGRYEGEFRDGQRHGDGKIMYGDGSRFEGSFEANEKKTGIMTFASGTVYEGEWRLQAPHGRGVIRYASGAKFIGTFENGKKHGTGVFESTDGSTYEGSWVEDAVTGTGRMAYGDGRVYEGEWRDGVRDGTGKCSYPNESVYDGGWSNDERVGYGEMFHADGSVYKGEWMRSQPHGGGSYTFENGDHFEGNWVEGKRAGQGKYEFGKFEPGAHAPPPKPKPPSKAGGKVSPPPPPEDTTAGSSSSASPKPAAVVSGGPAKVNGTYRALKKPGLRGETVYEWNRLFLYHVDKEKHYGIGRKKGAPACLCFTRSADARTDWVAYDAGDWVAATGMTVDFRDEVASSSSEAAPAVVVTSRFANVTGGYALMPDRELNGKAVYWNEEDGKYLWYGPTGTWLVSDTAGVGANGSYSSYVESGPADAPSPEEANWSKAGVTVRRTSPPGDVKNLAEASKAAERGMFRDAEFPSAPESLGREMLGSVRPEDSVWVRPTLLHPPGEPIELFNGIDPNDIMQGALGDCWLLSAISALAEFPAFFVDHLFVTKKLSKEGKYQLKLYDASAGAFETVTVDDAIPCGPATWWEYPRPLFAQPSQNELYILIIEKAFAKLAGGYDKLSGGYPLLALMCMTGCEDLQSWKKLAAGPKAGQWQRSDIAIDKVREAPYNFQQMFTRATAEFNQDPQFFDFLKSCDDRNFIMAASISGSTIEKARDDGLVERHAYSLIAVKHVKGIKLCQLRNPWGNDREWNGAWSDGSPEWTKHPDVKKQLGYEESDDGLFYMHFDDFKRIYDGVQICAIEMSTKRASSFRW